MQSAGSEGEILASSDMPPVDLVHLARYTLGDRSVEREVLQLFSEQAQVYLERLREARSEQDWREAAHSLKGSALAIGAWRTADAASASERMGFKAPPESREAQLGAIEAELGEARAYIQSLAEL